MQHHPAENIAHESRVKPAGEVRLIGERVSKREQAHRHGEAADDEQRDHEHAAAAVVEKAAFSGEDRKPERDRAGDPARICRPTKMRKASSSNSAGLGAARQHAAEHAVALDRPVV